jgi:hypothetical protein
MRRRGRSSVVVAARLGVLAAAAVALLLALGLPRRRALTPPACPLHAATTMTTASAAAATVPDDAVAMPTTMTLARQLIAPAWQTDAHTLSALLYTDELALLAPNEPGRLSWRHGPTVAVRRDAAPPVRWDDATWRVRFRVVDGARLPPGAVGWLTMAPRVRPLTVLPYAAVLRSPAGPYVLVVDGGAIAARPIVTGRALFDFASVLAGVGADERIIVRDAALFDAERRLAAATETTP